jgi:hypothetical protein
MSSGRWRYTEHCFWNTPAPFCWMSTLATDLHSYFQAGSLLMVFKGDLNYRCGNAGCEPFRDPTCSQLQQLT